MIEKLCEDISPFVLGIQVNVAGILEPVGPLFRERYLNPIPMQTEWLGSEDFEDVRSYVSSTGPAATCVVG